MFTVLSCGNKAVEKPDNLIDEGTMVDILYDISIIQSAENINPGAFSEKNIKVNEVIYKKYKIDSLTFAKSNRYYAADPHEYQKIFGKVSEKIKNQKQELNQQSLKETGKAIAPSDAPAIQ